MLVAISGSQGSGKTTVLNKLEQQGAQTIARKTSRSILTEWGVTLHQVNNDHDLTIKFQEEIIKRKYEDEQNAKYDTGVWYTERTFADLFTYSLISLGKDNEYSDWLNGYYMRCMFYQQSYWKVFLLPAGYFAPEHDGVRGSNVHYSNMVDITLQEYTKRMTHPSKLSTITTPVLDERIAVIDYQTRL
jgi:predicted ATPase